MQHVTPTPQAAPRRKHALTQPSVRYPPTHTAIRATPTHQPHPSLAHTFTILSHHSTPSRHSYPSASPTPPNNTLPLPSAYPWYPRQPYPAPTALTNTNTHHHYMAPYLTPPQPPFPHQPNLLPHQAKPLHLPPLLYQLTLPPTSHSHPNRALRTPPNPCPVPQPTLPTSPQPHPQPPVPPNLPTRAQQPG
ncbi:hypothetical protein Pcinc_002180 [Petrolisthes cinctipes]|uniref:Uncharacterized protein n=1 Tax=Petrolisthes cinctipes TaxID=88211 RepID=A0AAE1GQM0_PETCI|nr:hypothetical protein Pcinc_002180 [Petrolisthes cinctipes]